MSQISGLAIGIVKDVKDLDGLGRVQVELQSHRGRTRTAWAPIASTMGGKDRGVWMMPEVNDECIVAFLDGNPSHPVIVGYTWNGEDKPPSGTHRERMIRSLNGHVIRMLDETPGPAGAGAITIEDANGNAITLSNGKIHLKAVAAIEIDAPTIRLKGPGWSRVISPISAPI